MTTMLDEYGQLVTAFAGGGMPAGAFSRAYLFVRGRGSRDGQGRVSGEYGSAVESALCHSGYSPAEAASITQKAAAQRLGAGPSPTSPTPAYRAGCRRFDDEVKGSQ